MAEEIIELEPIHIRETLLPAGEYTISPDESAQTRDLTLFNRLNRETSFSSVGTEGALSFRGLSYKATEYVEDGIPFYKSVNGFVDTKIYINDSTLQINDGSGASTYGVSPMGGEIISNSKRPNKPIETKLKTTFSNNDEFYYAYAGSKMDDFYIQADTGYYHRLAYELSDDFETTTLQNGGKRLNSDMEQFNASLKSGVYLEDNLHLAAKVQMIRSQYGIPPNIYADQGTPVVWNAYSRMEKKDLSSLYLYADYANDVMELNIRTYYDEYQDAWKIYNDPTYQSSWPLMTYDDKRLGSVLKLNGAFNEHESTLALQAERNEHNAREEGAATDPQFVLDTMKASYIHLWKIDEGLQCDGAVSYTLLKDKKRANAGVLEPAEDKKALDALAKLTFDHKDSTVYGSIAKKSRMPSMNEMFTFFPWEVNNPGLQPEQSMQYSLGYQSLLLEDSLIDLSLYHYDIRDLIIYRNNGYINRESAKNQGIEISLERQIKQHTLAFSYAYTYTKDSENEALDLIPRHRMKAEDTLSFNADWIGHLCYQYIGSRYSQNTATYTDERKKLKPYHLVDVQINYKAVEGLDLRAGIKNLFDDAYESEYGYPMEGRSFYVSLEWEL